MRRKHPDKPGGEEMHVGLRFPPELAAQVRAVVDDANAFLRARGLPETITSTSVVKTWVGERLAEEFSMLVNRQQAASRRLPEPVMSSNVVPFKKSDVMLLDYAEAAKLMGISPAALRHRVATGRVPDKVLMRTGSRVQFRRDPLLAWMAEG
jgi:hypothetical protein